MIVVGSGPTGAMVATELSQQGVPVLMLESGRRRARGIVVRAAGNTVFRWSSRKGLDTGREVRSAEPIEWFSSRTLGGGSNYWTGSIPRFSPDDFTDGSRLDERYRWPVTYDDVEPFYSEVEELIGVTAGRRPLDSIPEPRTRYVQSMPQDWRAVSERVSLLGSGRSLGLMPMAKGSPWMVALRATEFNSYDVIVRPLAEESRFTLLSGRHVVRVERSRGSDRIDTVIARDRVTGGLENHRARAIVLAAGSLDTTEILLRSRSADHPAGLGNGTNLLGRYLHDHPRQWWRVRLDDPMTTLSHPLYLTRDRLEDHEPLRTAGFTLGLGARRDRVRSWWRGSSSAVGILTFATMVPTEDSNVRLEGDRTDPDRSDLAIDLSFDRPTSRLMIESRERCLATLNEAGVRAREDMALGVGAPGSSVHLGGTARMHSSREFGVIDGFNRLHDAPEVRVVDAASFTTGPEKNPTLTAMALALRSARHLGPMSC
ncbi:GMC oxidoreductase [Ilumatobacter sp.]|uniref:GMC oxidoreductase n=1 Tax=Ilumatobacter sp. TaxID=1967498 RepID=UPI003B521438